MKQPIAYTLFAFLFAFIACDIKKNKEAEPKGFFKIYNEENYTGQFKPLDIEQTSDEGYIILSDANIETVSSYPGIHVMKIDKHGAVQYTNLLKTEYVSAVPNLMRDGNDYYIVCMNRYNLGTHIIHLDASGAEIESDFMQTVQFPLSADLDPYNSDVIIQHYNKDELITSVSRTTRHGDLIESRAFPIGSDEFEQPIIDHLTDKGKQYPFQCGRLWDDIFYFNGFSNHTFSLCMFDYRWDNEDDPAAVQGYRDERGISSIIPLGVNGIATSRFAFGENYILPYAEVPITSDAFISSSDLAGYLIPELIKDAPVALKRMTLKGKDLLVYASTTKSSQVVLLAYDVHSGQLIGSKYLGATNPYEIANLIPTSDGGIAVITTTYVAGRFPRIALFKLDASELNW